MALNSTAGDSAAESYASLADATAYFVARGITTWAGTGDDAGRETALRRATTYLENQYRERWIGLRSTQTQALAWPRSDGSRKPYSRTFTYPLLDADGFQIAVTAVPLPVQRATMEAALLILTGSVLEPTLTRGGAVKSQSDAVGPLSSTTVWQDSASVIDRYTVIEGLLRGLVTSTPGASSGIVQLVRG